uniref:Uncharacterized protein n=1 Tax=Arundo donax TaxID=35708 RepID=A0A0A9HG05_ARUDO
MMKKKKVKFLCSSNWFAHIAMTVLSGNGSRTFH